MNVSIYTPARRKGIVFHSLAIGLFMALSAAALWTGLQQQVGGYFVLLLFVAALFFAPLPFLVYSAYALLRARYVLERDGLHLRWGLRAEDIPLTEIEWVRPAVDLPIRIPLPRSSWPGALIGSITLDELGTVEFLASERGTLVLVATSQRVYAISPRDMAQFLTDFQATFEMGSLSPITPSSILPAAYLIEVWDQRPARWMTVAGLLLALAFFAGISLAIPTHAEISLGFFPDGVPLPLIPGTQLLLLPLLALFFYLVDLALGLFFLRQQGNRPLGYLLLGSSILTTLLFISASVCILR